jgi:hypothetical protein
MASHSTRRGTRSFFAMHRRMHPGGDTAAMVETLIAAHVPAQQITQQ